MSYPLRLEILDIGENLYMNKRTHSDDTTQKTIYSGGTYAVSVPMA